MNERIFPKRKQMPPPERPVAYETVVDGKPLVRGQAVRVRGEQGAFVFQYVWLPDGSLTLYGGLHGHGTWRSVQPERVRHVKRSEVLREDDDAS